jgi:hypothetical protein
LTTAQNTLPAGKTIHNFAVDTAKTAACFGILHDRITDNTQKGGICRFISHGFFNFAHPSHFLIVTMSFATLIRGTVSALGLAMSLQLSLTATAAGAVYMAAITFSANMKF